MVVRRTVINYVFLKSRQRFFILNSSISLPFSLLHSNSLFTLTSAARHYATSVPLQHRSIALPLHRQLHAPANLHLNRCCPDVGCPPPSLPRTPNPTPPCPNTRLSWTPRAPSSPTKPTTSSSLALWSSTLLPHSRPR